MTASIYGMSPAHCVPWPSLSPDCLGTQGVQSPGPSSQGPGQLGGSRHGEGGDWGWWSPGAQVPVSLALPSNHPTPGHLLPSVRGQLVAALLQRSSCPGLAGREPRGLQSVWLPRPPGHQLLAPSGWEAGWARADLGRWTPVWAAEMGCLLACAHMRGTGLVGCQAGPLGGWGPSGNLAGASPHAAFLDAIAQVDERSVPPPVQSPFDGILAARRDHGPAPRQCISSRPLAPPASRRRPAGTLWPRLRALAPPPSSGSALPGAPAPLPLSARSTRLAPPPRQRLRPHVPRLVSAVWFGLAFSAPPHVPAPPRAFGPAPRPGPAPTLAAPPPLSATPHALGAPHVPAPPHACGPAPRPAPPPHFRAAPAGALRPGLVRRVRLPARGSDRGCCRRRRTGRSRAGPRPQDQARESGGRPRRRPAACPAPASGPPRRRRDGGRPGPRPRPVPPAAPPLSAWAAPRRAAPGAGPGAPPPRAGECGRARVPEGAGLCGPIVGRVGRAGGTRKRGSGGAGREGVRASRVCGEAVRTGPGVGRVCGLRGCAGRLCGPGG